MCSICMTVRTVLESKEFYICIPVYCLIKVGINPPVGFCLTLLSHTAAADSVFLLLVG